LSWPALSRLLRSASFQIQARHPLMAYTPHSFRRFAAPGVAVRLIGGDDPSQRQLRSQSHSR
jgi:hypothetical protein